MTRLASRCALPVLVATLVARAALAQTPSLGDFVLFADDTLKARGLVVESGDVGTNGSLEGTKRIDAAASRLVANSVDLDKATVCKALLANSGSATPKCGPRTPVSQPVVGNLASACGFPTDLPSPCSSSDAIIVGHDGSAEKAGGTYSRIDVAGGGAGPGSLVLTGGTYTICGDVTLRRNAQLAVRAPSVIRVLGRIKFDNGSSVGPESLSVSPCQIQIFSNGDRVRVSRRASVQATICAPKAKLELTAGAKLRGAFYANEVKSDRVTLDRECGAPTTTTLAPPTTSTTTTIGGSSTTSTSTTTSTAPALCGNGIIESGEQCDPPGSVGGAFCPPESACTASCQCSIPPTTSSTAASTTSTSTTTSTSSTQPAVCGNSIIESGEQCDPPGSAGGAFCPPESACTASCQCSIPPTTSSTTEAPTTTSTSTTSTQPAVCGNSIVESGEDCDPPGSAGGAFCPVGSDCDATCHCTGVSTTSSSSTLMPTTTSSSTSTSGSSATTSSSTSSSAVPSTIIPTTTSTSAPIPTTTSTSSSTSLTPTTVIPTTIAPTTTTSSSTSSSSSSSTTVTPTTIAPTTTTIGGGSGFDFLSTAGSGACGNTYRDLAGTVPLKNLLCGSLSLGGGISQVPDNATPPGATNRFTLTNCVGSVCNIGPTAAGSTPAGVDCTDIGCKFGTPLPISNAGLSVCVTNTFSPVPPSGTLDKATGDATWSFQLNSSTVLTGVPAQPCPVCAPSVGGPAGSACVGTPQSPCTGVCDGSPNQGAVCQSKNSVGVSSDCPSPAAATGVQKCFRGTNNGNTCSTGSDCPGGLCAQFIGNIAVSLSPLTTGTSSLSSATGIFCPGQTSTQHGAFKSDICLSGANSGKPCDRDPATGFDVPHCGAGIQCRAGTLSSYCVGGPNDGLGCSSATTCPAPGVCGRAGQQVQLIKEIGSPAGALAVGVAKPVKLGSAFCVAATTNPTVNSNANLPGPGGTSVTGTITLLP